MKKLLLAGICCLLLAACSSTVNSNTSVTPNESSETSLATLPNTEAEAKETTVFTFNVYAPNDSLDGFNETRTEIQDRNYTNILNTMISAGILDPDVTVNSINIEGSQLNLDLNSAFYDQLAALGSTGERYFIGSFVNTFLSAYESEGIDAVYITVNGQIMESGHVVYDFPMEYFE